MTLVSRPQTLLLFTWGSSSAVVSHCGKLKRGGTLSSTIPSSQSKRFSLQQLNFPLQVSILVIYLKGYWILSVFCLLRLAWQAMRQLHPEAIAAIQSKALFSQPEEALLAKIGSVSFTVTLGTFYCWMLESNQLKPTSPRKVFVFVSKRAVFCLSLNRQVSPN